MPKSLFPAALIGAALCLSCQGWFQHMPWLLRDAAALGVVVVVAAVAVLLAHGGREDQ